MNEYPSILLGEAVNQFASLPGMGRRSALRHVLALLRRSDAEVEQFTLSISKLKKDIKYCRQCHNISDQELCPICSGLHRDRTTVCVVENIRDVMSIENTGQYNGLYHVLGGVISPMDGVGPKELEIDSLMARIVPEHLQEIILALPTTMEGDTTNFYIYRKIQNMQSEAAIPDLKVSQIARGVAVGNDIEYTDEITLGRSIVNRTEYKG